MSGPLDLRFQWPVEPSPGPVDLRFGAPDVTPESVEGELLATLDALAPPVTFAAIGTPVLDLIDVDGVRAGIAHQQTTPAGRGLSASQQHMLPGLTAAAARQQQAAPLSAGAALAHQQMQAARRSSRAVHQHSTLRAGSTRPRHAEAIRTRRSVLEAHQHGLPVGQGAGIPAAETLKYRRSANARHQHALSARTRVRAGHHAGLKVTRCLAVEHQQMIPLPVGWWQAVYPWPPDPTPDLPAHLRFCHRIDGTAHLVFGCRPAQPQPGVVVPIREVYIVINTVTLTRASDGAPLQALSLGLSIDADSWTYGWDANIPGANLPLLEALTDGEPVELIATINGISYRLLAERIARDRSFAQSQLKISGRGKAAMLASPHAPIVTRNNTSDRTLQQLVGDALTTNGVPIGWALDWHAADWLVPAGLYNHTGAYIEQVTRIAEAAGAYVQSHPMLDTLRILPRYPLLPWEWAAAPPDLILPSAPVTREAIEWQLKPGYNRVYVSGTAAGGILGQVTRAGTDGGLVAPMITDPLITHPDAARARGRPILADTGRQAHVTLTLPVLPETGIIHPGTLVQYTDAGTARRGLVRSVSVSASLPTLRQSITLETHA